jgi:very-short-patch-repair endonuclease
VLDLAAFTATTELERLVGEALGTQTLTRRELERAVELQPHHRGAVALSTALQDDPRYTREGAERRLLALIRAARLPLPETNVMLHGYEVDMLWREQRLIVEIDSFWHHAQRPKFERDRVRDADLLAAGYRTLRVTWRALDREPFATIARLARALAASGRVLEAAV